MNQGNYGTATQTLGWPVLDLTNPQAPTYIPEGGQIKSLSPACYRITVKNTITVTSATIVVCSDATIGSCAEPGTCVNPGGAIIDPSATKYYNLLAQVQATNPQNGIIIEFDYLHNDTPVITGNTKSVNITVANTDTPVYLFTTNQLLNPDDTVSLYGARVASS